MLLLLDVSSDQFRNEVPLLVVPLSSIHLSFILATILPRNSNVLISHKVQTIEVEDNPSSLTGIIYG